MDVKSKKKKNKKRERQDKLIMQDEQSSTQLGRNFSPAGAAKGQTVGRVSTWACDLH